MAEIIDTFIPVREDVPVPEEMEVRNLPVQKETNVKEEKSRTWGEATEDVVGNILSALANGGKGLAVLGAGLEAGLNTRNFQERKNARIRAARMADLQFQQKEQQMKHAKENHALESESKRLFNQQRAFQLDALKQQQQQMWLGNGQKEADTYIKALQNKLGYNQLNLVGQEIFDNSENLQALTQAIQIYRAYQRSDAEGDFMLSQSGWTRMENPDGESFFISPDGDMEFYPSEENIKMLMSDIQSKLKDDVAAAYILGADSSDLQQYAVKNIIGDQATTQLFGNPGNALRAYNGFVNSNISRNGKAVPLFSKEEKLNHILSRTLQSAMIDGKISEEEKTALAPVFAATVKKMGAEVIWGEDIATTKVKLGNGYEVPLAKFANDIAQRDTVMSGWQSHLLTVRNNSLRALEKQLISNRNRKRTDENSADIDKTETELLAAINNLKFPSTTGESPAAPAAVPTANRSAQPFLTLPYFKDLKTVPRDEEKEKEQFTEIASKTAGMYKKAYDNLEENQKRQLNALALDEQADAAKAVIAQKKRKVSELSLDTLRQLDKNWKAKISAIELDPKVFYSPYQNEIFKRELELLFEQRAKNKDNPTILNDIHFRWKLLESRGIKDYPGRKEWQNYNHSKHSENQRNLNKITEKLTRSAQKNRGTFYMPNSDLFQ